MTADKKILKTCCRFKRRIVFKLIWWTIERNTEAIRCWKMVTLSILMMTRKKQIKDMSSYCILEFGKNSTVKENNKMYLLLFTIIYCVITQVFNMTYLSALAIYLIGLGLVKGFFSEELRDVFNFKKTKYLYEKNGFKDSLMELFSLMFIFINSYLIDYEPFSPFEFVYFFFLIALVYRFLFWGIARTIRKRF